MSVTTCENCGANAVDARGVCRACGWQVGSEMTLDDDSPSLGETRAADALEPLGTNARATRSAGATPPSPRGGTGGTARFCGTCGARLEPGEAFCGQCGTPVGASGDYTRNVHAEAPSRYYAGGDGGWSGGSDGDDYTEAYSPPPLPPAAPYNRPSAAGSGPYTPPGFGAQATPRAADQSQAGRIVFGLLCILGSIVSAAGAVYLAIVK